MNFLFAKPLMLRLLVQGMPLVHQLLRLQRHPLQKVQQQELVKRQGQHQLLQRHPLQKVQQELVKRQGQHQLLLRHVQLPLQEDAIHLHDNHIVLLWLQLGFLLSCVHRLSLSF